MKCGGRHGIKQIGEYNNAKSGGNLQNNGEDRCQDGGCASRNEENPPRREQSDGTRQNWGYDIKIGGMTIEGTLDSSGSIQNQSRQLVIQCSK